MERKTFVANSNSNVVKVPGAKYFETSLRLMVEPPSGKGKQWPYEFSVNGRAKTTSKITVEACFWSASHALSAGDAVKCMDADRKFIKLFLKVASHLSKLHPNSEVHMETLCNAVKAAHKADPEVASRMLSDLERHFGNGADFLHHLQDSVLKARSIRVMTEKEMETGMHHDGETRVYTKKEKELLD